MDFFNTIYDLNREIDSSTYGDRFPTCISDFEVFFFLSSFVSILFCNRRGNASNLIKLEPAQVSRTVTKRFVVLIVTPMLAYTLPLRFERAYIPSGLDSRCTRCQGRWRNPIPSGFTIEFVLGGGCVDTKDAVGVIRSLLSILSFVTNGLASFWSGLRLSEVFCRLASFVFKYALTFAYQLFGTVARSSSVSSSSLAADW